MHTADDDLPTVPATTTTTTTTTTETTVAQKQEHTASRFPQFEIALATVWRQLILSAGIALLGFVSFILTLIWDQQLWLAAISLLVGFVAALYALWLAISLQRFYATTANAHAGANAAERAKPTR